MLFKFCSTLYLDNDWIKIVANLRNDDNSAFIEEVYRTYGDLCNIQKVIMGQIIDDEAVHNIIYKCESHFSQELPLKEGAEWEINIDTKLLFQLKEIAEIKDYEPLSIRHMKGFKVPPKNAKNRE